MSAVSTLEPMQRYQYQLALNLKLRSAFGTAFQDFFSTVLEAAHGADFVRVRPFGSLGDKGCDGYRQSNGQVFQCYGKLEDGKLVATTLAKKVTDDYALASSHLQAVMKEWHFAHNLVDGVPVELILAIEGLKQANGNHVIGLVSPASLQELVLQLPQTRLETLLGPAATAADTANLRMDEVRDVVAAVIAAIDIGPVQDASVADVPADKLEFNKLPEHWVQIITSATKNAPHVAEYFEGHPNPEIGNIVATEFGSRYNALKLSGMKPGVIMDVLYEQTTGIGSVTAAQQVAVQALLAYLFDACEIFEDHSSKVAA
jgi:hypothetical protein